MMRPVTEDDFEVVHEIFMDQTVNRHLIYDKCTKKEFEPIFEEILNRCYSWIFIKNDEEYGFCSVTQQPGRADHVAQIKTVGIKKEYQNKGYGSMLLEEIIEKLKQDGFKRVELRTDEDNQRGISFYKKMGFFIEGYQKKYFKRPKDGKYIDNVYMAKLLED
ncbi:MAG: GNAT family N-acetyltransferase [Alphaproteobacteria bacterium]|nr:GNAT family N-acetyltransferase [Alphaproteobacteria bacterium]